MEPRTFYANRGYNLLLLFLSLLMTAAALFVCYIAYQKFTAGVTDIKGIVFGILGVLFFGITLAAAGRTVTQKVPSLIIDSDGIVLDNYPTGVGRISWSNIRGARIQTVNFHSYLLIDVIDNDAILAGLPAWKKMLLRSNYLYFSTPVFIHKAYLSAPLEEVLLAIENARYARLNQHRTYETVSEERVPLRLQAGR